MQAHDKPGAGDRSRYAQRENQNDGVEGSIDHQLGRGAPDPERQ